MRIKKKVPYADGFLKYLYRLISTPVDVGEVLSLPLQA